MRKGYDNPGRVSFQLALYFLCHAQVLADLSNPSTERDQLRPSTPAQLCWSSSSSFPHICTTKSWNWTAIKLILLLKGVDSITFRFLQCPGVLALICVFSSWILISRQIKSTQLCFSPVPVLIRAHLCCVALALTVIAKLMWWIMDKLQILAQRQDKSYRRVRINLDLIHLVDKASNLD